MEQAKNFIRSLPTPWRNREPPENQESPAPPLRYRLAAFSDTKYTRATHLDMHNLYRCAAGSSLLFVHLLPCCFASFYSYPLSPSLLFPLAFLLSFPSPHLCLMNSKQRRGCLYILPAAMRRRTVVVLLLAAVLYSIYSIASASTQRIKIQRASETSKTSAVTVVYGDGHHRQAKLVDSVKEKLPPKWEHLKEWEKNLPQHNLDLPYPEGQNGRYVKFSNQIQYLGWNNLQGEACVPGFSSCSFTQHLIDFTDWYSHIWLTCRTALMSSNLTDGTSTICPGLESSSSSFTAITTR